MSKRITTATPGRVGPPNKHQLALMIWLSVVPTLTVLNLVLGDWLITLPSVLRTFVLATIAAPVVIYGLMPQLHKIRARLVHRTAAGTNTWSSGRPRLAIPGTSLTLPQVPKHRCGTGDACMNRCRLRRSSSGELSDGRLVTERGDTDSSWEVWRPGASVVMLV